MIPAPKIYIPSIIYTQMNEFCTLGVEMFGLGDFWLETKVIIKILTHSFYHYTAQ